jgi:hypothetical protein
VHQTGHEALKQLPLAQHEQGLVPGARGEVGRALDRPAGADEPGQEACAAGEEAAADEQQRGEPERARENGYAPRAFLSSALIAGTISCRSPITA